MCCRNILTISAASLFVTVTASIAQDIPYQSDEFNDPNSTIPTIFGCMFAGHQSGSDPSATETAMNFMFKMDIEPDKVDTWAHDATIYVSQELSGTNWSDYWMRNCEQQFSNMRSFLSQ